MKSALKIGLLAVSLVSVTSALVVAAKDNNGAVAVPGLADAEPSAVVTAEMLQATELVDWDLKGEGEGHYDKKFRLNLSNGRYIDGGLIFNDCGYQSVGSTLGDPFMIDNTDTKANAYNFNVLFSLESSVGAIFNFTAETGDGQDASISYQVKHALPKPQYQSANFYQTLESGTYSYHDLVSTPSESAFYSTADNSYNSKSAYFYDESKDLSISCYSSGYTVVAFQFTYYSSVYIDPGESLTCTLTSISFFFDCN